MGLGIRKVINFWWEYKSVFLYAFFKFVVAEMGVINFWQEYKSFLYAFFKFVVTETGDYSWSISRKLLIMY